MRTFQGEVIWVYSLGSPKTLVSWRRLASAQPAESPAMCVTPQHVLCCRSEGGEPNVPDRCWLGWEFHRLFQTHQIPSQFSTFQIGRHPGCSEMLSKYQNRPLNSRQYERLPCSNQINGTHTHCKLLLPTDKKRCAAQCLRSVSRISTESSQALLRHLRLHFFPAFRLPRACLGRRTQHSRPAFISIFFYMRNKQFAQRCKASALHPFSSQILYGILTKPRKLGYREPTTAGYYK